MRCGFCGRPATEKGLFMGGTEQMGCAAHAHLLDQPRQSLKECNRCKGPLEHDRSREDVCCRCTDNNYLTDQHLTVLAQAFLELNTIRARDGAPRGVDHDYFSSVVDGLDEILRHLTGKSAHCHPALYVKRIPVIGARQNDSSSHFDQDKYFHMD